MHVGHLNSLLPEVEMEIETSPLPIELLPQSISDSSSVFTFTDMSGDSETAHSGLLSTSPREYLHPHLLLLLPTPALFFLLLLNKLEFSPETVALSLNENSHLLIQVSFLII